jgi:hypothetical protein
MAGGGLEAGFCPQEMMSLNRCEKPHCSIEIFKKILR